MSKTLALIPARGGSKGIPGKNIKDFCGKPLIAWTIEAARAAHGLDKIVVSTDCNEIAAVAKTFGAEIPFIRPSSLAGDHSTTVDVAIHAIQLLPGFDRVMILQPTSPLRTSRDISNCIRMSNARNNASVVSVEESTAHPLWMYRIDSEGALLRLSQEVNPQRRQDLPVVYLLNGAIYLIKTSVLIQERTFIPWNTQGYIMSKQTSVDIDDDFDWLIAETLKEKSIG